MKIRNGFVSNSSSSSFIICRKGYIKDKQQILDYIKTHEECVGYYSEARDYTGEYFTIKGYLRDKILEHFDEISNLFEIVDTFHYLNNATITEAMVGCDIEEYSGWDGEGCPIFVDGDEWEWECAECIDLMFGDLSEEELANIKAIMGVKSDY